MDWALRHVGYRGSRPKSENTIDCGPAQHPYDGRAGSDTSGSRVLHLPRLVAAGRSAKSPTASTTKTAADRRRRQPPPTTGWPVGLRDSSAPNSRASRPREASNSAGGENGAPGAATGPLHDSGARIRARPRASRHAKRCPESRAMRPKAALQATDGKNSTGSSEGPLHGSSAGIQILTARPVKPSQATVPAPL